MGGSNMTLAKIGDPLGFQKKGGILGKAHKLGDPLDITKEPEAHKPVKAPPPRERKVLGRGKVRRAKSSQNLSGPATKSNTGRKDPGLGTS